MQQRLNETSVTEPTHSLSLKMRWFWLAVWVSVGAVGCNAPKDNLALFNRQVEAGQFALASSFAEGKLSRGDTPRGDDLLWTLQLGATERLQGRYAESSAWFDKSEGMLQYFATDNAGAAHAAAAAVVNDNVIPYNGSIYDGIMVNTYKALNFMRLGNHDLARVEFNRALDRQRRAKEDFNKQIQAVRNELDKNQHSSLARRSAENADLRAKLEQSYPSLYSFEAYPDFVNPFSTYLAGVFFTVINDYSKASDVLKESTGMLPNHPGVMRDFAEVEQALNTGSTINPTVWVFFENGLGPVKEEFRVDLPLFIVTDKVRYFGIALPRLVFRPAAAPHLDIRAEGRSYVTEPVGDMDRIIQTEFKKEFDGILLRAILSATAKAAAQYALEENNAQAAAILMAFYNYATTAADVRIWSSLPKNFQATRLARPADGRLILAAGQQTPITVELGDCTHAIVYVKMVSSYATPTVELITF